MKISTHFDPPPMPIRNFDWSAVDDETYGGDPADKIGWGRTEEEAVTDLLEQLAEPAEKPND